MRFDDYLRRIGQPPPDGATIETLRRLHLAHREAFLFENLSIQTGGAIRLGLADLESKFLDEGRGGYCFEHNTLFAAALADAGFTSTALLGRVRRGPPARWARTHMVLRLSIGGEVWLADVGFGGAGLLEPIPLRDGAVAGQGDLTYRLRREERLWVLSMRDAADVESDLYEFTEDPQTPMDVEIANHFTSTHPESIFRKTLTIQRAGRAGRTMLRSDGITRYVRGQMTDEPVARAGLRDVARAEFDVDLPEGPFVFENTGLVPGSRPDRPSVTGL